jgi:hypothetical protein
VEGYPDRTEAEISWVDARWDGLRLQIECRCDNPKSVSATVVAQSKSRSLPSKLWVESGSGRVAIDIAGTVKDSVPQTVVLSCGELEIRFQVMDTRVDDGLPSSELDGMSSRDYEEINDALLLEQYGGAFVEDDPLLAQTDQESTADIQNDEADQLKSSEISGGRDSYEIGSMSLARLYLGIVDQWNSAWITCQKSKVDPAKCPIAIRVLNDGQLLVEAFGRQALRDEQNKVGTMVCALIAQGEMQTRLAGVKG